MERHFLRFQFQFYLCIFYVSLILEMKRVVVYLDRGIEMTFTLPCLRLAFLLEDLLASIAVIYSTVLLQPLNMTSTVL